MLKKCLKTLFYAVVGIPLTATNVISHEGHQGLDITLGHSVQYDSYEPFNDHLPSATGKFNFAFIFCNQSKEGHHELNLRYYPKNTEGLEDYKKLTIPNVNKNVNPELEKLNKILADRAHYRTITYSKKLNFIGDSSNWYKINGVKKTFAFFVDKDGSVAAVNKALDAIQLEKNPTFDPSGYSIGDTDKLKRMLLAQCGLGF